MVGMEFVKDRASKNRAVELRDHIVQRASRMACCSSPAAPTRFA